MDVTNGGKQVMFDLIVETSKNTVEDRTPEKTPRRVISTGTDLLFSPVDSLLGESPLAGVVVVVADGFSLIVVRSDSKEVEESHDRSVNKDDLKSRDEGEEIKRQDKME